MSGTTDSSRTQGNGQTRHPTMQDVARHVGVSRQLVSLVMRGVPGPSEESRERIIAAAEALGYKPNVAARLLRQSRTRLIGVVFAMRNPFQVRVVERLYELAAEAGFGLALGPLTMDRSAESVVSELQGERVEAIIAFNPGLNSDSLLEAGDALPIAWLGEWVHDTRVDNVHVDEIAGLDQAVQYLQELGHTRITYVGGEGGRVGADRADAYAAAMRARGLGKHVEIIVSDFSEEGGAEAARKIGVSDARPTAVICCGDQCAAGVLAVFAREGIRVPEDVSVVGFDDSYLASLSYNALTSVRQDADATAEAAFAAVVGRLEGTEPPGKVVATPTELIVRSTTAAPGARRVSGRIG